MNNTFTSPNRLYKDRLFKMIFNDKTELLKLYNAINGTHYNDPAKLIITTLENAIYMTMENDLSFIIDMRLTLYEQQASINPNLPLRFLMYITDIYSAYTRDMNLYGSKPLQLPPPSFVIFYNGTLKQPDRKEYYLSDLFHPSAEPPSLELKAVMLNINKGHTVEKAITECIQKDVLRDFLLKNKAEAKAMSIYEYDEEKTMRMLREEAFEDGLLEGIQATISTCIDFKLPFDTIIQKLTSSFHLSEDTAKAYLNEYLSKNNALTISQEASTTSIYEYNEEKTMRMLREEAFEDGSIQATINSYMDFSAPNEVIIQKLISRFHLSEDEARNHLKNYFNKKS